MTTARNRLVLVALVSVACSGGGVGGGRDGDGDGDDGRGDDARGGSGGTRSDATCGSDDVVKNLGVARLTALQYRNTMATLLGDRFTPPELPGERPLIGFPFSSQVSAQTLTQPLVEALAQSAHDASLALVKDIDAFAPCAKSDQDGCGKNFITSFGRRVFRRPLGEDEVERYQAFFSEARQADDYETAVQMTAEALLTAPQFLYRLEAGDSDGDVLQLSPWQVATRLSYLLTNDMPDDALMDAAAQGDLDGADGVRKQAERLLSSDTGRAAMTRFLGEWLNVAAIDALSKADSVLPDFGPDHIESFRQSYLGSLAHSFEEHGTLSGLLTGQRFVVDARIGALMGIDDADPDLTTVDLSSTPAGSQRAGFLTHPAWLAMNAHDTVDAPVLRGLFVFERLLCLHAPPPPNEVPALEPFGGKMTARMALEKTHHVKGCVECHAMFDPFGFAFGHYDAVGRWRDEDAGYTVDAKVDLPEPMGGTADGALELARSLSESAAVQRCVATQWFRHAFGRAEDEEQDRCIIDDLTRALDQADGNFIDMILAMVSSKTFSTREASAPSAPTQDESPEGFQPDLTLALDEPPSCALFDSVAAVETGLLRPSCAQASCHSKGPGDDRPEFPPDFEPDGAGARLRDHPIDFNSQCGDGWKLIDAAEPDRSFLLLKVAGGANPQCKAGVSAGDRMPRDHAPLSAAQQACIRWYVHQVAQR